MAGTQSPFEAVFSAIDKATAPLRRIAASIGSITEATKVAGDQSQHLDKLTKSVKHTGEAAAVAGEATKHLAHGRMFQVLTGHVRLLRTRFGELGGTIGEAGHSLSDFLPMLAALGAAGSLTGLVEMVEHTTEAQASLAATAVQIGVTTKQLNALNLTAKLTDVGTDRMQMGFIRLQDSMAKAATGKNKDVAGLFHHLGISLKDAHGHLRTVEDVLPQLSDAFEHTTNPTLRVRMAMALMGRSGAEMLPFLTKGSAALKAFADQSAKVDFTPDAEGMEGLEKFHQSWILLTDAVTGFTTAITTALAPVLTPIITTMQTWMATNRDWLVATGVEKIKELGSVFRGVGWILRTVDWAGVWGGLLDIGRAAVAVISGFRWLGNVFGVAAVAAAAVALVMASPLVGAITGIVKAIKMVEGALVFLDALVMANPLTILIASIVAVAGAAFLIYEFWGPITRFFGRVWGVVVEAATWAWNALRPIRDAIGGAAGWIMTKFDAIGAFFTRIWHSVSGAITGAWAAIKPPIDLLGGVADNIVNKWTPLGDFFRGLWSGISGIFDAGWLHVKPIVTSLENAASFVERHLGFGGGGRGGVVQAAAGPVALAAGVQAAARPAAALAGQDYTAILGGSSAGPWAAALPLPPLYAAPVPVPSDGPRSNLDPAPKPGEVHVTVDVRGVPPGSKVTTTSARVRPPTTSVGYSNPLAFGL